MCDIFQVIPQRGGTSRLRRQEVGNYTNKVPVAVYPSQVGGWELALGLGLPLVNLLVA